ncbi:hypothetical protein Phi18:2_gp35 [Cellulophaga phage phi18:2]|uniref:Uncharacterized protein n=2 Tax=Cellulophaga phage phi18:1 TaxID=1327982 RepID=S0A4L8_9CAUD|nr:hypothetical protein Phi18:1_gp37 [Cellulophaga phage phi18:1]AGO48484.1 hypothetical protein Phi18:1_gp37 [Cellulophaga phage phi18:1]AGO49198.1 hypothetical protein Phi18:2_gp35 [Cellulophaga phage phi18:2]
MFALFIIAFIFIGFVANVIAAYREYKIVTISILFEAFASFSLPYVGLLLLLLSYLNKDLRGFVHSQKIIFKSKSKK